MAVPVEEIDVVNKGGVDYVTGATLNIYNADQVSIASIYELSLAAPIPLSNFTKSYVNSSGSFVYDSNYELKGQYISYNAVGQPLESLTRSSGAHHCYLWDYNSTYQTADVTNASQADIAYTSFEADGSGNWTLNTTARAPTGFSGIQSYPLSATNTAIKSELSNFQSYIISYWTNGGAPLNIAGTQSNPTKGETVNGWTYYEHMVSGQSSVTLSSATSVNIDELRLYPKGALMNTWTYSPLVGISSAVNQKNQITYYDYDSMLRLTNIKDKNGNIIQHTDYHYQGQ